MGTGMLNVEAMLETYARWKDSAGLLLKTVVSWTPGPVKPDDDVSLAGVQVLLLLELNDRLAHAITVLERIAGPVPAAIPVVPRMMETRS